MLNINFRNASIAVAMLLCGACKKEVATTKFKPVNETRLVSTMAGSGSEGSADGLAAQATFAGIWAMAIDAAGNLYVTNVGNNSVRKITPAGAVSTLADKGSGTSTGYSTPLGVAVDDNQNVYISYLMSGLIRKVSPAGAAGTFASINTNNGGQLPNVLQQPMGLAFDAGGYIYVAGYSSHGIGKFAVVDGQFVNFSGILGKAGALNGTYDVASFNLPTGVAVDKAGNLYIADSGNQMIRKITYDGFVSTVAGSGQAGQNDGMALTASFNTPTGLAVDAAGNIYVADYNNNMIRKITTDGLVFTIAGTGARGAANGDSNAATFNGPTAVAIDAAGNIYVADRGNNLIRKISQK